MTTPLRPQQYRLSWPLTPSQVEGLDAMLETLFKRLRAVDLAASAQTTSSGDFDGERIGDVVGRFPVASGIDGEDGLPGLPGLSGTPGVQGLSGVPGVDGDTGGDGERGIPGPAGVAGVPGLMGPPGEDGADGGDILIMLPAPATSANSASTLYAPGVSITVATGNFLIMSNHLILSSTQRATIGGTGRLRMTT